MLNIQIFDPPTVDAPEVWLRVHSDTPVVIPMVVAALTAEQVELLRDVDLVHPVAYRPGSPVTADERSAGMFVDWWAFPGALGSR